MAPGERNKFGAPMFEPEVFRKQMYCFEEKCFWHCCDFFAPHSDSAPLPPSWHLWCYAIKIRKMSENKQIPNVMNFYSMNICNFRTQYHIDLAQTANKSYWRHFKLLREAFVSLLILPHAFLRCEPVFVFLIIKLFRHSTSHFLSLDKFENNYSIFGMPLLLRKRPSKPG